jgi:hypothetical protein
MAPWQASSWAFGSLTAFPSGTKVSSSVEEKFHQWCTGTSRSVALDPFKAVPILSLANEQV